MRARQVPGGPGERKRKWEERVSRFLNSRCLGYTFYGLSSSTSGTAETVVYSLDFSESPFTTFGDRLLFETYALFSGAGVGNRKFRIKLGATLGTAVTITEVTCTGPDLFDLKTRATLCEELSTTITLVSVSSGISSNAATFVLFDSRAATPSKTYPQTLFVTMEDPVGTGYLTDFRVAFENGAIA